MKKEEKRIEAEQQAEIEELKKKQMPLLPRLQGIIFAVIQMHPSNVGLIANLERALEQAKEQVIRTDLQALQEDNLKLMKQNAALAKENKELKQALHGKEIHLVEDLTGQIMAVAISEKDAIELLKEKHPDYFGRNQGMEKHYSKQPLNKLF